MKRLLQVILLGLLIGSSGYVSAKPNVARTLWDTSFILFDKYDTGWYASCMATPFEQLGEDTYFVTAAHCLSGDAYSVAREIDPDAKERYDALVAAVNKDRDVAVLRTVGQHFVLLPLGVDPEMGDDVMAVTGPKMLFKVLTPGLVAAPIGANAPSNRAMIYMNIAEGASGSAVYCITQGAICAILVAVPGDVPFYAYAVPISELQKMKWR